MSKPSNRTKWCFTAGCIGRDMNFILVSMFVLPYIQYTMNLSVAQFSAVSAVMILARVWDAVNDPMMGILIENVRLKGGKFRPWILLGGVLNFFVTLIMFRVRPQGWSFVLFFSIVYIAWGMTYTINDISYHSLLPNLADSNEGRNELANLLQVFASIGQFLAGGLIPVLVTGNAIQMYKLIGLAVSFIFLMFTLLTYFGVRENPARQQRGSKLTLKRMFRIIAGNDQLLIAAAALLMYTVGSELFVSFSMNYFYFHFGYGGSQLMMFTVAFAVGTMAALLVFSLLSKKLPRKSILRVAVVSSSGGSLLFFLSGTLLPLSEMLLYTGAFFQFLGTCLFFVVLVVYIANTIEYNAVKTGERNDAVIASVRPFMSKLGAALQQLIFSAILLLSGVYTYSQQVAALEVQKNAGVLSDITVQANHILSQATDAMRLSIKAGMCLIPTLLLIAAYVFVQKKYAITEEVFASYVKELDAREG